ncbi:hypothetical protein AX17_007040 [Amanita inopinata Kibby_2008]|nr:hypothetical protein AX17_007040 [Amanita inopinata Kibby_2008]
MAPVSDVQSEHEHQDPFPSSSVISLPIARKKTYLLSLPTRDEIRACWELCRLHNNIGFWVVWLPTAWSITMIYHAKPQVTALDAISRAVTYIPLCFGIKSMIMTIDDILDADVDGSVERTKHRPLPRGAISLQRAWLFFGLQVLVGLYLAHTCLSPQARHVSMFVWPLYIFYPTCKRWTNLAPIPLGLMFAIGIYMGWSDLDPDRTIDWETLNPIYIGATLWTCTYETVYQHQDKTDDIKIGLHSPALLLGRWTVPVCTGTACGFLGLLAYGGALNNQGAAFFISIGIAGVLLISKLLYTDVDRPEDCRRLFLDTPMIGMIILAGLVVDSVFDRLRTGIPL